MSDQSNIDNTVSQENGERSSNVYSIAPGLPFLQTLATSLIDGELIAGFAPVNDPTLLANATVYLPTRRAARAFSLELLSAMSERRSTNALLLPTIRTIGDLDDEEVLTGFVGNGDMPLNIGKPINPQIRQLILASFSKKWSEALNNEQRQLLQEEDIVLPSSAGDAIRLASNLASFMDQVETEEVDWQSFKALNDDEYQQWWQITLTFLKIIMSEWPQYLSHIGKMNPAAFRQKHTDFRIEQLPQIAKQGPVIIAGSTGSIPATARLIAAVSKLENGAVVLPGIDHEFPDEIFDIIAKGTEDGGESVYSTHPQFGLMRLAHQLKAKPDEIKNLNEPAPHLSLREKLHNIALLPPENSADWVDVRSAYGNEQVAQSFSNMTLINAPGERQEALAIALLFRQALSVEGKTAALVTPDRNLARRVASELERFGIEVDDSGGAALSNSPAAMFLRQVLKVVFEPANAINLSSLFKSQFLTVGFEANKARSMAELLELLLVRNALSLPNVADLAEECDLALAAMDGKQYAPKTLKDLAKDDEARSDLIKFADGISQSVLGLYTLSELNTELTLDQIFGEASKTLESLNQSSEAKSEIFTTPSGKELFEFLNSYQNLDCSNFPLNPHEVTAVVEALLSEKSIRVPEHTHPRLHIYGPLEARLQTSDLMILGGLNEGTWPQLGSADPFLNRPMRAELNLPLPERRIGLSAHDFQQLLGNEEVVMTRANRVDNAPTVASRWVQRLATFLGDAQAKNITKRGDDILQWVEMIDQTDGDVLPIAPPYPTPPVSARPKRMSITDVEKWIRDPYAIYAKHVLQLYPMPPLQRDTDAALKGTLYHDILASFVSLWHGPINKDALVKFDQIADEEFNKLNLADEVKSVWRPRFNKIAADFLDYEYEHRKEIKENQVEIDVESNAKIDELDFCLTGRADRINVLKDGSLEVVDYKTGTNPSAKVARTLAPQLSLEGALVQKGKFENVKAGEVTKLAYIRLREGEFRIDDISKDRNKQIPVDDVITDAWAKLKEHIIAYQDPERGYTSRYAPRSDAQKSGDYDHLARVREWSLEDDEMEGYDA